MKRVLLFLPVFLLAAFTMYAQNYTYNNSWGKKQGFNLSQSKTDMVNVVYSVRQFSLTDLVVNGQSLKKVSMPGVFLFNDAGKPDLPGTGRYIAIPQGSTPHVRITDAEVVTIQNLDLAPAPQIPLDTQTDIIYPKDAQVYSTNAFYPANPVQISAVEHIRGTDVVILGITPFQYNPVTKEMRVYKNIKVELTFEGGSGKYGNDAFRSPYWDPIMADNILNYSSLPVINYPARMQELRNAKSPASDECEYIIISPNGPVFLSWADSLKNFRNQQGILTKVFSLADVGGNTETAIQSFIDNAYNNWTIKPVACLLLGDYGTDDSKNIISHLYVHPDGYPNYASDNFYADVDGDDMPDVVFARIAANDSAQLHTMVGRILNFERNRPTDTGYYNHPISALGWEDDRWFQLCSEIVGGYWKNVLHKTVQRINALYTPANNYINGPWSTAPNTGSITSYFGTAGLNYIPDIPGTLGGFTGGNATQINNAINNGSFVLLHRDHGAYTLWGEPSYSTLNINQLTNTLLPFVFSINCETGAFHNPQGCPSACFQEVFQRLVKNGHDAGALGLVCPTETSYSFVNDTFVWGMFDNMWPNFMPDYGTTPSSRGILPCFGNAAGKYFLKQSSWPYNSGSKQVTYRLFHMHGDAFLTLADTVPQNLSVVHDTTIIYGTTSVSIQANDSAFIALSVANEIIATAYGSGSGPITMTIPVLPVGTQIMIVATKQDFNRYTDYIMVTSQYLMADFSANKTDICESSPVNFTDLSGGQPTGWSWTFQGGTPSTSTEKDPANIVYSVPGTYDVTLTVSKSGQSPNTTTKPGYIHVYQNPDAAFIAGAACASSPTPFTDQSDAHGGTISSWSWNFGDPGSGSNNTSDLQNPTHVYAAAGNYSVSLSIVSNGSCTDSKSQDLVIAAAPGQPAVPSGNADVCQGTTGIQYTTNAVPTATSYTWVVTPDYAGTFTGTTNIASLDLDNTFSGPITVKVLANSDCGPGAFSDELPVNVNSLPGMAAKPSGPDSVNTNRTPTSIFTTDAAPYATGYHWILDPATAGTISGTATGGDTAIATWAYKSAGTVKVSVKSTNNCGEAPASEEKTVVLSAPAGISENNSPGFEVFPNPSSGKITLVFNARTAVSMNINVFNSIGSPVFTENNLVVNDKFSRIIDLSMMPEGIYYIKIESDAGSFIRKLVIRK
jgi:PKD repeat protein